MKITVTGQDEIRVEVVGAMNEDADLNTTVLPLSARVVNIDLQGLTALNSIGIRTFRDWLGAIQAPQITFAHCPRFFIDQVNAVAHFIPARARFLSFQVPFFNEESGEEKLVLYKFGDHFSGAKDQVVVQHPVVQDSTGAPMELDTFPDRYFNFLKKF